MNNHIKYGYWMMLVDYDMETIDVLIKGNRWVYVTYLCHQAMERQLKGMYVYYVGKEAPKSHNLDFLFNKILAAKDFQAQVDKDILGKGQKECKEFLVEAMFYYMSDYPFSYKNIMTRFVGESTATKLYDTTREMINWMRSLQQSDVHESQNPQLKAVANNPAG